MTFLSPRGVQALRLKNMGILIDFHCSTYWKDAGRCMCTILVPVGFVGNAGSAKFDLTWRTRNVLQKNFKYPYIYLNFIGIYQDLIWPTYAKVTNVQAISNRFPKNISTPFPHWLGLVHHFHLTGCPDRSWRPVSLVLAASLNHCAIKYL